MAIKVIYVAGYGRSGSTILDIALGQHPEIFGGGELSTIFRHVWPRNEYCACGARVRDCPVWSAVVADWIGAGNDPAAYLAAQTGMETILPLGRVRRDALASYRLGTTDLIRSVRDRSGRAIVLDSSKLPGRGLALAGDRNIDLRVVHLVRDARAVAHSMNRPMDVDVARGLQKPIRARLPLRTAMRWTMVNAAAERLVRSLGPDRALRVRYEDFLADPARELARIGEVTGTNFDEVARMIAEGDPMKPGHQVAGSRIRMGGAMTLRPDLAWRDRMPLGAKRAVATVAGVQLRRYGYLDRG